MFFSGCKCASIFENAIRARNKNGHAVVNLSNPKSVYADLMQYWQLDAGHYQMLPRVLYRGLSGADPGATDCAQRIVSHISEEGLDATLVREGGVKDVKPDGCKMVVSILIADSSGQFSPFVPSYSPSAAVAPATNHRNWLGWALIVGAAVVALIAHRIKPSRKPLPGPVDKVV